MTTPQDDREGSRGRDGRGPPHRRVWAQDVAVGVAVLRGRLEALRARDPDPSPCAERTAAAVAHLLQKAEDAAFRRDPQPRALGNWWRGTLIEAAYENLHAAEAEVVVLYDRDELDAEIPEAVARVQSGVHQDDPRRWAAARLPRIRSLQRRRLALRKAIEVGYAAVDRQHSRVRSFRNVVLLTAAFLTVLVVALAALVAVEPTAVPLCFTGPDGTACPTGGPAPGSLDVLVVAVLGLVGGALAAAVSVRGLRGTSTPYDVPVALALLKAPAGALTAIGALVAIRGEFVPGLSALDSQEQVLAYALVFGYGQQVLTRLIDRQANAVLDSVPSKDPAVARPMAPGFPEDELEPEGPVGDERRGAGRTDGDAARPASAPVVVRTPQPR